MPLLSEKTFEKKQTFDFPTPWAMNLWGVEFFSCTIKTPKQTYCSRNLQEKAKIIEEHLKGVSKAKLMEKHKIPIATLNRILRTQESILNIVDSKTSLKIPKSACRMPNPRCWARALLGCFTKQGKLQWNLESQTM